MKILYRDHHLLVVEKPAGLLTQGDSGNRGVEGLEEQCSRWWAEERRREGKSPGFLQVVHRLDTPVSGIVLIALSSKALERLQEQLRRGIWKKEYRALVEGKLESSGASVTHWLFHDERAHRSLVVSATKKGAKSSTLRYEVGREVIFEGRICTYLAIDLVTGRYHQIRAQLAALGHPVVGDRKYGARIPWREGAIALHHRTLQCTHPISGELLSFTSEELFLGGDPHL